MCHDATPTFRFELHPDTSHYIIAIFSIADKAAPLYLHLDQARCQYLQIKLHSDQIQVHCHQKELHLH